MDASGLKNWKPVLKLSDYKAKVDYSVKRARPPIEAFRTNLMNTLNRSPNCELNTSKESKSSVGPNYFNHYSSLSNFRTLSGIGQMKHSASNISTPQQPLSPSSSNGSKYTFFKNNSLTKKESPVSMHYKPDITSKHLNDVISIGTLHKATGMVTKGALDQVPLSYIRQLQNFCIQVKQNLRD